jgi:hypothetical protein
VAESIIFGCGNNVDNGCGLGGSPRRLANLVLVSLRGCDTDSQEIDNRIDDTQPSTAPRRLARRTFHFCLDCQ